MKVVNEYSREQFTDEEVQIIENVADVVCNVFNIDKSQLKGFRRFRDIVDARKVLSHYICNNLRLSMFQGKFHVALPAWYLHVHHSSICYYNQMAEEIYKTDASFREKYDLCMSLIRVKELVHLEHEDTVEVKRKWEDVRLDGTCSYQTKLSALPKKIAERIKEMYEMGYTNRQIAYSCLCTNGFINKYVSDMELKRMKPIISNKLPNHKKKFRVSAPRYSTKIDY